mmetsp:Transcript_68275/g.189600  ORF Transcript_68275/g.189600 Transcript_68275/m.189600 type:complete len:241 (+) Transcript_68275:106-828(+)
MDAIREKYNTEAGNAKAAIPERFLKLDALLSANPPDVAALSAQFAITDVAAAADNSTVGALMSTTTSELFFATSAMSVLETWLKLCVPAIEDGNNFGVGIVMEAAKMCSDARGELEKLQASVPDYYKERGAAYAAIAPKTTTSTTESTSKADDKSTKDGTLEATAKEGASSSSETKTTGGTASPDQISHVVALDVMWYLKLYAACDRVRSLYAAVCDFLEKNEEKIQAPKGERGGGMSMY